MRMRLPSIALLTLLLGSCSDEEVLVPLDWSLNRMTDQDRYTDFKSRPGFSDARVLQPPPVATIPLEQTIGPQPLVLGLDANGAFLRQVPIPVDEAMLRMGRNRFDRFCGVCHGNDGMGETEVATKMPLVKPPSLHRRDILAFPAGRLYQVITFGYGMMPTYAYQLTVEERWAVVAYVQTLQFSQNAKLDALPPELQARFTSEVP